jgi:hypothetical protein
MKQDRKECNEKLLSIQQEITRQILQHRDGMSNELFRSVMRVKQKVADERYQDQEVFGTDNRTTTDGSNSEGER